jgi:hypothetical protein
MRLTHPAASRTAGYLSRMLDLEQFRDIAFRRSAQPDHPLRSLADAEKAVAELPHEPLAALAELTSLAKTMNETDAFTAERRTRILFILDEAARERWRALSREYLAPGGTPLKSDGDINILRAFFDSASEFADGIAIALDHSDADKSPWFKENLARVNMRSMRWLGRRLALAHMLHLPVISAVWERIHRRFQLAEAANVSRVAQPIFAGNRQPTSVRQEYVRCLLLELAAPDSMTGREIELAFRVTGRVAAAVRLEATPSDSTVFAVVPAGDAHPVLARRIDHRLASAALYLDTTFCLPKLRAGLERDMDRPRAEPDTLYGGEYTIGERFAMLERLLAQWGMDPPQRRARRVVMGSPARVISGFDNIVNVLPAYEQRVLKDKTIDLQIEIDDTIQTLNRAKLRAAQRVGPAHVIDASNGGLGIAMRPVDARWAALGVLVAVLMEPGKDWIVGVVRRLFSLDEELRIGIQVLSTQPHVLSIATDTLKRDQAWEDAIRFEASFNEKYKKAILLDPRADPAAGGDLLLEAGLASKGAQFDIPFGAVRQRIRVARVVHASDSYQRVVYEPLRS